MKYFGLLLLLPVCAAAQINPAWIVKDNLVYTRMENCGGGYFGFEKNGKYGYIDKTGKEVIPATFEYPNASYKSIPNFYDGYAEFKSNGSKGLIDKTGKVVVPADYYSVTYNPSARVVTASKYQDSRTTYGLLSIQNKILIPFDYDYMSVDSNIVQVKKGSKYGVLDLSGKELIPIENTGIVTSARNRIIIANKGGTYTAMDLKGQKIFEKPSSVYTLYGAWEGFIKCQVNGKYGFLDLKGNEVVATKYDYAGDFNTMGIASVGKKNPANYSSYSTTYFYGFVDKKGTEVIPLKYEFSGSIGDNLIVMKDPETNRYGYLDRTGKWVLHPAFIDATNFNDEGMAQVKMTDGKFHCINKTGKDLGILNANATSSAYFTDGYSLQEVKDQPYVLIDKNGKTIKTLADCSAVYNFSEGIGGFKSTSSSLYGFIDINGKVIHDAEFTGFAAFTEGISRVSKTVDGKTKYGYVNSKGEIIVPIEYSDLTVFRNGWGIAKKDGTYYFIDAKGQLTQTTRKYDLLQEFKSGFAFAKVTGASGSPNTYYYINPSLKEELTIESPEAYGFWDDVAVLRRDKSFELMNKKGDIFKTLDDVDQIKFATDGAMAVKKDDKWGFLDTKGNEVTAAIYDSCDVYKYGYAKVMSGKKWGIIDKSGKEVIAPKYDNILPGDNGVFIVLDTYWGVVDKTGKTLVPPIYYTITPFEKDRALARTASQYVIVKSPK